MKSDLDLSILILRLWNKIGWWRRVQLSFLLVLMILASIFEVISIGAVIPFLGALTTPSGVVNSYIGFLPKGLMGFDAGSNQLLLISVCFALITILAGLMRLGLMWFQTRLSYLMGADFSFDIYRRTLYQPYLVHIARNSSDVISGITIKANSLVENAIYPALTILSSAILLSAIMGALFFIDTKVASLAIFGFIFIYLAVIKITKKYLHDCGRTVNKEQSQVVKAIQEGLGGIRDVLIDGTQSVYSNIYQKAEIPLRRSMANIQIISTSPRFIIEALGIVLIIAIAYMSASQEHGLTGSIPVLGALALAAQRMLPVLQQGYVAWAAMQSGAGKLNSALDLLDQQLPLDFTINPIEPIRFTREITLKNVAFVYPGINTPVLSGVNFIFSKGSRIGVIGETGSGKSTLLDILMGLVLPTNGEIFIDGVQITKKNSRAWQKHIAHVPQAIFLADVSVAENIAFGTPFNEIDFKRVKLAAQRAKLSSTIELWDDQYSTIVGERGMRLSGGQRQRIGIARALYKNADVIIFDEATSALDSKTEQEIIEELYNLSADITVIMVAHRISTLRYCDKIIEIKNSTIARSLKYSEIGI
jgi:ATP-binding cassette subfamily B protein